MSRKDDLTVLLIDRGEFDRKQVGEVYIHSSMVAPRVVRDRPKRPDTVDYPLPRRPMTLHWYRLLFWTLMGMGNAGSVMELAEFVWPTKQQLARLESVIAKIAKGEWTRSDFHNAAGTIRRTAKRFSDFTETYLDVKFMSPEGSGIYGFSPVPNFCLVQVPPEW